MYQIRDNNWYAKFQNCNMEQEEIFNFFCCCCEGFFYISCLADNSHEMPNLIFSEIDDIFIIFSRQQDFIFHANCLQMETICMKCQNQFSDKNLRKKIQYVVCWIF